MKLRMLYFGIVREKLGRREEIRTCPDSATVAEVLAELAATDRIFTLGAGVLRVAVNREYVDESHILVDNDEVAIIPPVAGGSGTQESRANAHVVPRDNATLLRANPGKTPCSRSPRPRSTSTP